MIHIETHSELLIVTVDASFADDAETALVPLGWRCRREAEVASVMDRLSMASPAALLIDSDAPQAEAVAAAIRELAPPLNGTPMLPVGEGGPLEKPLSASALLDMLRQRAGPLEDHGLRAAPWSPRYRLIRLLGLDAADGMLRRLREALAEAVGETEPPAHRLAGIAGMCGFADLSEAWSRVDRREGGALPGAMDASRRVIAEIDGALGGA